MTIWAVSFAHWAKISSSINWRISYTFVSMGLIEIVETGYSEIFGTCIYIKHIIYTYVDMHIYLYI